MNLGWLPDKDLLFKKILPDLRLFFSRFWPIFADFSIVESLKNTFHSFIVANHNVLLSLFCFDRMYSKEAKSPMYLREPQSFVLQNLPLLKNAKVPSIIRSFTRLNNF